MNRGRELDLGGKNILSLLSLRILAILSILANDRKFQLVDTIPKWSLIGLEVVVCQMLVADVNL